MEIIFENHVSNTQRNYFLQLSFFFLLILGKVLFQELDSIATGFP